MKYILGLGIAIFMFLISNNIAFASGISGMPDPSTWPFNPDENYFTIGQSNGTYDNGCDGVNNFNCWYLTKWSTSSATLSPANVGNRTHIFASGGDNCYIKYTTDGLWHSRTCSGTRVYNHTGLITTEFFGNVNLSFYANSSWDNEPFSYSHLSDYGFTYNGENPLLIYSATYHEAGYGAVSSSEQHGNTIQLGLEGDTYDNIVENATQSSECKIDVIRNDTSSGSATLLDSIIGTVKLNSRSSINKSTGINYIHNGNIWEGYDWYVNSIPTDTTWKSYMEIPYTVGVQTSLTFHTQCYLIEYECSGLTCTEIDRTQISDIYTNPQNLNENLQDNPWVTEPSASDPLQWLIWRLNNWYWKVFDPSAAFNTSNITNTKNLLATRAPFAYAYAVLGLNMSEDEAPLDTLANMNFGKFGILPSDYTWTPASWFDTDLFSVMKTTITIFLWLSFTLYMFHYIRRIFR